jgi:tetratricopeptide (TPR) repeat protein
VLDFAFYQKRGGAYLSGKEYELAIVEYDKALELNSNDAPTYLNRGLAFLSQKNYDRAVADFDKAIELNPNGSMLYFNRGDLHEKMGNPEKAIGDYQKASELDSGNEPAKANLQRLQAERSKLTPKTLEIPETTAARRVLNVGSLNNLAVNLAVPVYTALDRQRNLQGIVTVQVMIDEKGKVLSAKATAGPVLLRSTSEAAALKSRFKPAQVGNQAVKATGYINYNFKAN